jgi:hypothetical protein
VAPILWCNDQRTQQGGFFKSLKPDGADDRSVGLDDQKIESSNTRQILRGEPGGLQQSHQSRQIR